MPVAVLSVSNIDSPPSLLASQLPVSMSQSGTHCYHCASLTTHYPRVGPDSASDRSSEPSSEPEDIKLFLQPSTFLPATPFTQFTIILWMFQPSHACEPVRLLLMGQSDPRGLLLQQMA